MTEVMSLTMPSSYVDLSKEEMEYEEGGVAVWVPICAGVSIFCGLASVGLTVLKAQGRCTWDDATFNTVQNVLLVVGVGTGIASGVGGGTLMGLGAAIADAGCSVLFSASTNAAMSHY